MDTQDLDRFLHIARERSITRAAKELGISQPGLSRLLQRLERDLGVALLQRGRGGAVALTPAGERLRAYADGLLAMDRRLRDELRGASQLQGDLHLAASSTPGEFILPDLVARFAALHPDVRPQVFITDSAQVLSELRERRWELGFVGAEIPAPDMEYAPFTQDQVVLAVPARHPFASRAEVRIADLEGQPFLEREGGSGTLLSVRSALEWRRLPSPKYRVVMVLSSTQAVVNAVERGYGMGLVSSLALRNTDPRRVAVVRLAELPRQRPIYVVRERRRTLSPVASEFLAWALRTVPASRSSPRPAQGGTKKPT